MNKSVLSVGVDWVVDFNEALENQLFNVFSIVLFDHASFSLSDQIVWHLNTRVIVHVDSKFVFNDVREPKAIEAVHLEDAWSVFLLSVGFQLENLTLIFLIRIDCDLRSVTKV